MSARLQTYLFVLVLLFASFACTLSGVQGVEPDAPTQALNDAQGLPEVTSVEATAVPTETSMPTAVPPPTSTPAPEEVTVVAFVGSDRNIYLYSSNQLAVDAITSQGGATDIQLSADGLSVAYLRREETGPGAELWLAPTDGSGEFPLITRGDLAFIDPAAYEVAIYEMAWVPGENKILYNTRMVFEMGPGLILYDDLHVFDLETMTSSVLLPTGEGGGRFVISPDGGKVAIAQKDGVRLLSLDGSDRALDLLDFPLVSTYSESYFYPIPVWAPDSSAFTIVIPPADPLQQPVDPTAIYRFSAGGEMVFTSQVEGLEFFGADTGVSGDMSSLVFLRRNGDPLDNRVELFVSNIDGSSARSLAIGNVGDFQYRWAPDGARLLYSQYNQRMVFVEINEGVVATSDVVGGELFLWLKWLGGTEFVTWQLLGDSWYLVLGDVNGAVRNISDGRPSDQGSPFPQDFDAAITFITP